MINVMTTFSATEETIQLIRERMPFEIKFYNLVKERYNKIKDYYNGQGQVPDFLGRNAKNLNIPVHNINEDI